MLIKSRNICYLVQIFLVIIPLDTFHASFEYNDNVPITLHYLKETYKFTDFSMKRCQELIFSQRKDSDIFALRSLDKQNYSPFSIRINLSVTVILKDQDNGSLNEIFPYPAFQLLPVLSVHCSIIFFVTENSAHSEISAKTYLKILLNVKF